MEFDPFLQQLDAQNNEDKVRYSIAAGHYNRDKAAIAGEWLARRVEAMNSELKARSEERLEEDLSISRESLSIARSALSNSRLATRIAISAIVLSIIMAIYEIIKFMSA